MADSQFCQRCGTAYEYDPVFYGHVGHYRCPNCGLSRPTPDVRLERLLLNGIVGAQLVIQDPTGAFDVRLPVPGLYNALNALAATAATLALAIAPAAIRNALEGFTAAFGRIERIQIAGRDVLMALIKNPVGASETVRMITGEPRTENQEPRIESEEQDNKGTREQTNQDIVDPRSPTPDPRSLNALIVINDRIADGTDVSWLWDADFERLAGRVDRVVVSGTRAGDMAVRLKYAGVEAERITVEPELGRALDRALALGDDDLPLYLLPTYTAMLDLRKELVRRGLVKPFWED
jgi:UDP-N-acetylmuramyl tripeptide synthase